MKRIIRNAALILFMGFVLNMYAESYDNLFKFVGDKEYKSKNNVTVDQAVNQSDGLEKNWWRNTAFYHIWVKSFADSNGDGCGDFNGITQNLDYIKDSVGCDGIWLSPIFDCYSKSYEQSVNMHGYDTVDYYNVNDCFGTMQELEILITECHKRGIKIIFDFIPNHTSPGHPWFQDSVSGKNNKDWYMLSNRQLNWTTNMEASGWHSIPWDEKAKGIWFYGAFGQGMPDLNFRNYEVREEFKNILRFWLNKGFDGVRIDAVRYLIETPEKTEDTKESHEYFNELRTEVIDAYPSPKFMVCEAWIENSRSVLDLYFGTDKKPEFNMIFDFDAGRPCYTSAQFHFDKTEQTLRQNPDENRTYATFLGNHDLYEMRPGTRMRNDARKIKQVTSLSLLRPNVPFIYYGNELGAKNYDWADDMQLRGPFDWNDADQQKSDSTSVLNLNKAILSLRKEYPKTFADGKITKLNPAKNTRYLAYTITGNDGNFLCVFNFSDDAVQEVTFNGIKGFSTATCLIGDTEAPEPVFSKKAVTIKNLAPCAYRVYLLNDDGRNIWDDEIYIEGEKYIPSQDTKKLHIPAKTMYIRGTMNSWNGTEMTKTTENEEIIWKCEIFVPSGWHEYKFCVNNSATWGANWGMSNGQNFAFKSEGKKYKFVFNETTLESSYSAIE